MGYDARVERAPMEAVCDLRGTPDAAAELLNDLRLPVPERPNSSSSVDEIHLLWVGPRHWMVRAPLARETDLEQLVERGRDTPALSVVLVSDYYASFTLGGPQIHDVLAQALPLDLRPDVFVTGAASFTACFGITALIHRATDIDYRMYVERSYADFISARLQTAVG